MKKIDTQLPTRLGLEGTASKQRFIQLSPPLSPRFLPESPPAGPSPSPFACFAPPTDLHPALNRPREGYDFIEVLRQISQPLRPAQRTSLRVAEAIQKPAVQASAGVRKQRAASQPPAKRSVWPENTPEREHLRNMRLRALKDDFPEIWQACLTACREPAAPHLSSSARRARQVRRAHPMFLGRLEKEGDADARRRAAAVPPRNLRTLDEWHNLHPSCGKP